MIDRVIARAKDGAGYTTLADRDAAFHQRLADFAPAVRDLLAKVAKHAWRVTDEDVAAAKAAGITEEQLFELIVCATLGQAKRQYDGAMHDVEEAFR